MCVCVCACGSICTHVLILEALHTLLYDIHHPLPQVVPDVWLVEFGENFDASLDQYEALLAMLMFDHARFGKPAVVTAGVAKNVW